VKVQTILDQIELGSMALPEFQRGYVWNREQVRGLMGSLYRKYPVGSLLVWVTKTENATARGDPSLPLGSVRLLLDGQQRITSLYGIVHGKPPQFFEGNAQAFTGLYFHLEDETFEFYAPAKMKDNPLWISVSELMQAGIAQAMSRILANPDLAARSEDYINRLNDVHAIRDIDLHIEEVVGEDKTVDVVVDVFNRVNSGGTKLSKGDLALAKICAEWPDARQEMNRLEKWRRAGFHFRLEWLLRSVNTVLTGEALFSALKDVDSAEVEDGLNRAEKAIDYFLNLISARLGLDHDRVLGSRYAFPLLSRYYWQRHGDMSDPRERDKLLYWYVQTILWGRYAGSTETVLNQDLDQIETIDGGLDRLIDLLRRDRPDLRLYPNDFLGWSKGARFYPLLYMLTRVGHARDWDTGVELTASTLGQFTDLHVHHVFPKSLLYEAHYSRPDVNAIANFTFLTLETNLKVSNRDPAEYLAEYSDKDADALASHWIPLDPKLWQISRYPDFLAARRELIADAANKLLERLAHGEIPEAPEAAEIIEREVAVIPGGIAAPDEEELLTGINEWVSEQGLPEGELSYEVTDPETGEPLAILDIAWPDGLQEGLSAPVALLIDEDAGIEEIVNRSGYRFFTDEDSFKEYVRLEIVPTGELALPLAGQQLSVR
jgi:hypothetical protein